MRLLEESVILTLKDFGITAGRIPGLTGVWLGEGDQARKICALGVKTSRWVTQHGLAFNINADLNYFNHIIPCGIDDKGVTSLQKELGKVMYMNAVKDRMQHHLSSLFGMELIR
jgi:lipoate-protein ligase B